jgi:hypothetical protein
LAVKLFTVLAYQLVPTFNDLEVPWKMVLNSLYPLELFRNSQKSLRLSKSIQKYELLEIKNYVVPSSINQMRIREGLYWARRQRV